MLLASSGSRKTICDPRTPPRAHPRELLTQNSSKSLTSPPRSWLRPPHPTLPALAERHSADTCILKGGAANASAGSSWKMQWKLMEGSSMQSVRSISSYVGQRSQRFSKITSEQFAGYRIQFALDLPLIFQIKALFEICIFYHALPL